MIEVEWWAVLVAVCAASASVTATAGMYVMIRTVRRQRDALYLLLHQATRSLNEAKDPDEASEIIAIAAVRAKDLLEK